MTPLVLMLLADLKSVDWEDLWTPGIAYLPWCVWREVVRGGSGARDKEEGETHQA